MEVKTYIAYIIVMEKEAIEQVDSLQKDLRYLQLLSERFPTSAEATSEMINLEAILNLPKGTEHFLADVHGEHEAFNHVLKNASGSILRKIKELFGRQMLEQEMAEFATLVYYPKEKLGLVKEENKSLEDWYKVTLDRLIKLCRKVSEKYTRSKVRKSLPPHYSYIIQELLHEEGVNPNKSAYIASIFSTIISSGKADDFIISLCDTIKRLVIDRLHVVGDIFDRGPGAQYIMDTIMRYHNVDIQWGNHDILWMGAAAGNAACMANVIRIALRYANLDTIEEGYGINMLPLARFAMETYANDPCERFKPKMGDSDISYDEKSAYLISQMHKAIAIIQFKLEYQLIKDHPEYEMDSRNLLHKIDWEKGTLDLTGMKPNGEYGHHPMLDMNFPTVDPKDPYKLSPGEESLVNQLVTSFYRSAKLHEHIKALYRLGSMYLVCNGNLLYHASMPLDSNGELKEIRVGSSTYKGRALLDKIDSVVRDAYQALPDTNTKKKSVDYMWYLWCGANSPLFDKSAMTTFERYFIQDKETHTEEKGYYYKYRNQEKAIELILKDFGLEGPDSHIINGHVPVKAKKGEKPLMAGGKLLVIDGGFSRAYQSSTGIAGYTLIFNSRGLQLVQHEPFSSTREAIENLDDIRSVTIITEQTSHRILVEDTDVGKELRSQVDNLKKLLLAYDLGLIKEKEASK